jgi:hypothetical protein
MIQTGLLGSAELAHALIRAKIQARKGMEPTQRLELIHMKRSREVWWAVGFVHASVLRLAWRFTRPGRETTRDGYFRWRRGIHGVLDASIGDGDVECCRRQEASSVFVLFLEKTVGGGIVAVGRRQPTMSSCSGRRWPAAESPRARARALI